MITRRLAGAAVLACGVAAVSMLLALDPATSGWFPPCPLHAMTGLACPGCGSTRALHALVHGNPQGALAFNPFLVLSLPVLALGTMRETWRIVSGRDAIAWRLPAAWGWAYVTALLAFAVLRNVPGFEALGPPR